MEKVYENLNKYGEEMKGKFSHNPHGNGIIISVTSPFVEEIHIECDENVSGEYRDTYWLLGPQANHPEGGHRLIYYNTQENCYYKCEWRPKEPGLKESEWGYIWVMTDERHIVKHAIQSEQLQAHFRRYNDIHKGQLCVFRCYAVDPNGQYKLPSTVESMFDRHKWFYAPFSFEVSLFNEDTIDDFVEETPISKEMTDKMVLYHKSERKDKRRTKRREFCQNLKDKLSKPWESFTKQENLTKTLTITNMLSVLANIILAWLLFFRAP